MQKLFSYLNFGTNSSNSNSSDNLQTPPANPNRRTVNLPPISPGRNTDNPQEIVRVPSTSLIQREVADESTDSPGGRYTQPPPRSAYENQSKVPLKDAAKAVKSQVVDPQNAVFNSFIGVNRLPRGKILIGNPIGSGAFGDVFQGKWGEKKVALKQIDFEHALNRVGLSKEEALEALSWEISRLSTVSHPNIVQFYGIYQHENEGATYLVTEFCEGGDLRKKLNNKKETISWGKRWQWALQITEAVAYLHSEGVLHRDLKAENVLLDGTDRAKLADLGVSQVDALLQESEAKVVAKGMQDARFIAPEYMEDTTLSTKATDIYALGLVLWEIASGEEPDWEGGEPLKENRIPKSCPARFKELILKCCEVDPAKRPSAEQLLKRIKQLGPELNPQFHVLIQACERVEKFIHPKRKEGLAYIEPFVSALAVEETIENYWDKWENTQKTAGNNPPLNLKYIFKNFLKKPGSSTLLLLGESGLGKTLTTYQWAEELMQQWWSYIKDPATQKPAYFPIFIRAAVSDWRHSALKGAYLKIAQLYALENTSKLVFVDGYDELQMDDEAPSNLVEHLGLLGNKNTKLIVTCRPKTVEDNKLNERFNFKGKLETVHFLPFSINQLLGYLKEQLGWERETEEEYKKTLQASKSVREVLRNPFVLYLLRQSWETLSQEPLNKLNRWKIYGGFVKHSITTQRSLLSAQVQATLSANHLNLVEGFEVFAAEVAFRACQKGSISFSVQEAVNELTYPWVKLEALVKEEAFKEFASREAKLNLGTKEERRALLSEADFIGVMQKRRQQFEGDLPLEIRREEYTFSHKSIFEYFVAKRLLEIFESKDDFISEEELVSLADKLVKSDPGVLLFLHEGWKEREDTSLTIDLFLKALSRKVSSNSILEKIAILLNAMGEVLRERAANYVEALGYHNKSLAIWEQVYGKGHPHVAQCYNNIGRVLYSQGRYEEALPYYKKALAIWERVYGKDHPHVAIAYNNIGAVLDPQGKYEEVLSYYKKALAIWERVYGKDHPHVATSYNDIGDVLRSQGKYEEALGYYKQSLAIREQVYGKDHPHVATSYNDIGDVLRSQGKYTEAREYELKAAAIKEKIRK